MICPRCKTPMREQRGTFHKKRKWRCPRCGRARMQRQGREGRERRHEPEA